MAFKAPLLAMCLGALLALPPSTYARKYNNESVADRETFLEDLETGAVIVTFPVVAMMLGSVVAVLYQPSTLIRCLSSATGAGILVAAVAFELCEILIEEGTSWYAGAGGFMFAIVFFIVLEKILPGLDDEDEEDEEGEAGDRLRGETTPLLSNALSASSSGRDTPSLNGALQGSGKPYHIGPTGSMVRVTDCSSAAEADWMEGKFKDDPLYRGRVGMAIRMCKPTGGEQAASYHFVVCGGNTCKKTCDIEATLMTVPEIKLTRSAACLGTGCSSGPHLSVATMATSHTELYSAVTVATAHQIMGNLDIAPEDDDADKDDEHVKKLRFGSSSLPWARIGAVGIDGFIDGLTLGIAVSVGLKQAALIAVAMTMEMCFVGVSLCSALSKYGKPLWVNLTIAVTIPLFMYLGFVVGAFALYDVDQTSDLFIAVIGFAAAALLYLALAQLIPECIELADDIKGIDMQMWITLTMFSGFVVILILEKVTPEDSE